MNNWDGIAVTRLNTWLKKIQYYIEVDVDDGVMTQIEDPTRDIFYYPDNPFVLNDANEWAISDFGGMAFKLINCPMDDDEVQGMENALDFLDGGLPIFGRFPEEDEAMENLLDFLSVFTGIGKEEENGEDEVDEDNE